MLTMKPEVKPRSMMSRVAICVAVFAGVLAVEVAGFLIVRDVGDFVFLLGSVIIAITIAAEFSKGGGWLLSTAAALVMAGLLLPANPAAVLFARGPVLNLTADYGGSFLLGFVIFFVVLPLIALTVLATALAHPLRRAGRR
jgi:hypothetical protein